VYDAHEMVLLYIHLCIFCSYTHAICLYFEFLWLDGFAKNSNCGGLFVGVAARETAQALRTLAQAARGVAASTKEPQAAAAMLDSAQCVMEGSAMLIHEAHQALVHPGDAESQQRLAQVA